MCRVCDSATDLTAAANRLTLACNTQVSLRRHWNRVLNEEVPDQLKELLRRLDQ